MKRYMLDPCLIKTEGQASSKPEASRKNCFNPPSEALIQLVCSISTMDSFPQVTSESEQVMTLSATDPQNRVFLLMEKKYTLYVF
jgi:hypothetical protein